MLWHWQPRKDIGSFSKYEFCVHDIVDLPHPPSVLIRILYGLFTEHSSCSKVAGTVGEDTGREQCWKPS